MIKSLQLENFKAFGKRVKIPCAPITLIFGENSSGKSSILHALSLLKQTRESAERGALLLPRSKGGFVDLGSFQELLYNHDLKENFSIRFGFSAEGMRGELGIGYADWIMGTVKNGLAIELSFKRKSIRQDIYLANISVFITEEERHFAHFVPEYDAGTKKYSRLFRCEWLTANPEDWKANSDYIKQNSTRITKHLKSFEKYKVWGPGGVLDQDVERRHKENIDFLSSDFTLDQFITRNLKEAKREERTLFVDGFVPKSDPDCEELEYPVVSANLLAEIAGSCMERIIDALFPLGPLRNPPERWYIYSGIGKENVGSRGEYLTDLLFRSPELTKEANRWLKRLDIGYQIKIIPLGPRYKDLLEIVLVDTCKKDGVEVNLSDVGFGISQSLPFIIQSLAGSEQIISIEQPEIHVHPRLQADLGDLVARTIKDPYNNQFLIETHSEHLMLRIQRLIRDKKLTPTDVSVLFVSRGRSGSTVKQLRLDDDGDFIDDWPGGFFPERLRELR